MIGEIRDKRQEWLTVNLIVLIHSVVKVCAIPVESAFGHLHIETPFIIFCLFGSVGTLNTALHVHITCSVFCGSCDRDNQYNSFCGFGVIPGAIDSLFHVALVAGEN